MKFSRIAAVIAMLSIMALPVMAELTDYQKGVDAGLRAGGQISYLLGAAPYNTTAAQQYNKMVNQFNAWLQNVFGNNQTAINTFWMNQMSVQTTGTGYQAYPTVSTKPVHSIDGSWNQSTTKYNPDLTNKIYGYDPDTYYTMVGWSGSGLPTVKDSNGNYIGPRDSNGNPIDNSLQPP
jgi:hypothetical protein